MEKMGPDFDHSISRRDDGFVDCNSVSETGLTSYILLQACID